MGILAGNFDVKKNFEKLKNISMLIEILTFDVNSTSIFQRSVFYSWHRKTVEKALKNQHQYFDIDGTLNRCRDFDCAHWDVSTLHVFSEDYIS